ARVVSLCENFAMDKSPETIFQTSFTDGFEQIKSLLSQKTKENYLIQALIPNHGQGQLFSGFLGMLGTANMENPACMGQVIEVGQEEDPESVSKKLLENYEYPHDTHIQYQKTKRRVLVWKKMDKESISGAPPWKNNGIYLITGGAGGLGMIFAREIAKKTDSATLILTGRSIEDASMAAKIKEVAALGAGVEYRSCDLGSKKSVDGLINGIEETFGPINGILHGAGVVHDNFIFKKSRKEFKSVLVPKVRGTLLLDRATRGMDLDFFVLFSSGAGATGNPGQADYASANAFMDAFAVLRNSLVESGRRQGQTLSIDWPFWKNGGMQIDQTTQRIIKEQTGLAAMETQDGIDAFCRGLFSKRSQVMVLAGDARSLITAFVDKSFVPETFDKKLEENQAPVPQKDIPGLGEKVLTYFKETLSQVLTLPMERIQSRTPFEAYGIDSIIAMKLTNELEKSFGSLSKTLFFEYRTIQEISDYFISAHAATLLKILEGDAAVLPKPQQVKSSPDIAVKRKSRPRVFAANKPLTQPGPLPQSLDIAVIGLSGRYPEARDLDAYWQNLKAGRDCITQIPNDRWDWKDYYTKDRTVPGGHYSKWGGFITDVDKFDSLFFNISPRLAQHIDPQERLFLEHAWMALEDAGYCRQTLGVGKDPHAPAKVGVYAGVMYGDYQLVGAIPDRAGDILSLGSGSYASIANRVSFALDLQGPSMTLDTMCSGSLYTLHLACQDLRQGHTNLGLAGGVNLTLHPNKYYILSSGQYISSKGRCQSFGAGADGYIPGEGVGVAVLKRLADAQRDGDHIYGVIKGSAVNHGGKTHGYSVPNPKAQHMVIAQALEESGINPEYITYIEAHGTGTKLGDPIEITGLTKSYGKSIQKAKCYIGSVKSNIGHCEAASGIAGLTKILLQMKYKKIVPSLHSSQLNPHIDFTSIPFQVNQVLREWNRPVADGIKMPRIAGISSFGAGGSNAHLVVEEYAPDMGTAHGMRLTSETSGINGYGDQRPFVILLSARTDNQLLAYAKKLLNFVQKQSLDPSSGSSLESAGNIQGNGDRTGKDKSDLTKTAAMILARILHVKPVELEPDQSFKDYGVEPIHLNRLHNGLQDALGIKISRTSIFKTDSIDSTISLILRENYGMSDFKETDSPCNIELRDLAYTLQVGREAMAERLGFVVESVKELETKLELFIAQKENPASGLGKDFFKGSVAKDRDSLSALTTDEDMKDTIEIWIKKKKYDRILDLWIKGADFEWTRLYNKAKPNRMSLPTYPFEPERYWIEKPKEIEPQKVSSMLHPLLHINSSTFEVQGFSSVFNRDEFFFKDHRIQGEMTLPGVAYFEMARAAVEVSSGSLPLDTNGIRLENIVWTSPVTMGRNSKTVHISLAPAKDNKVQFEIFSEKMGHQVKSQDDKQAGTSVHCRGMAVFTTPEPETFLDIPVLKNRLDQGRLDAGQCYDAFSAMGIEYGPGQQGIETLYTGSGQVLAELVLPDCVTPTFDQYVLHPCLMDSALQASLGLLGAGIVAQFSGEISRPDQNPDHGSNTRDLPGPALPFAVEQLDIRDRCTDSMWAWIRFSKGSKPGNKIQKMDIDLCDESGKVCVAIKGFSTRQVESREPKTESLLLHPAWTNRPIPQESHPLISHHLVISPEPLHKKMKPWPQDESIKTLVLCSKAAGTDQQFSDYSIQVFLAVQALLKGKPKGKVMVQLLLERQTDARLLAGLMGILKTARLENPNFMGQLIWCDPEDSPSEILTRLKDNCQGFHDTEIRYKGTDRQVLRWEELVPAKRDKYPWKDRGVYLITGGMGGLGMIFAREIIRRTNGVHLILTGRSELNSQKETLLDELRTDQAKVIYKTADISRQDDVDILVQSIVEDHGTFNGIIHSAGVLKDSFIIHKNKNDFKTVLAPKVSGIVNLDHATCNIALDLFVLFSSGAGAMGNLGQADYATANGFMDAFGALRNQQVLDGKRHGQTLSVNWPLWEEGGMGDDPNTRKQLASMGMTPMKTKDGIQALYHALSSGMDQVMVLAGDLDRLGTHLSPLMVKPEKISSKKLLGPGKEFVPAPAEIHNQDNYSTRNTDKKRNEGPEPISDNDLELEMTAYLKQLISNVIQLPQDRIKDDTLFEDYGIDSVMIMELTRNLETDLGSLPKTLFFEYTNIRELAGYFLETSQDTLKKLFGTKRPVKPSFAGPVQEAAKPSLHMLKNISRNRLSAPSFNKVQSLRQSKATHEEDIAIIGISGRYPGARNIEEFWENLRLGKDCVTKIPGDRWDNDLYYDGTRGSWGKIHSKWGGFIDGVDEFDPLFF
ncbi:MAG: SDR family NAD(P)-dependent oxidoreductase, partial [Desulfobacteraceae bacterium]|nr:SDR family NAD(P)-dependent oxidoreductase [Desulfobacteraceae bacterium]